MSHLSRRQFLYGSAAALSSLSLGRSLLWAAPEARPARLPRPERSGIDHIVVAMMENRSFDHLLGWLPGASGRQTGLIYKDSQGVAFKTYSLAPDFQGCGHHDPDHTYDGGRIQYNDGLCDGWLRSGASDIFAIGYYTRRDLPFLGKAAPDWTVCDRYFAPFMGPTSPNRLYQHAAVTDRLDDSISLSTLTTIWDRLADAGLDGRYYHGGTSFLDLWGLQYSSISQHYTQFLQDSWTRRSAARPMAPPPITIPWATFVPASRGCIKPIAR